MMSRRLADRYVLGEEVGVGGMSRVHVALDERLGRRVAVKLQDGSVMATADPAGRERFLREGRTTAAFSHRHAVTVFDAGEDAGDLYIVMEFVDGPSLAEHLAGSGPLPVDEMVRISRQVLSALAAAHSAGIVHRDVKPANVLIGADGDTKLADFGIAKRFDDLSASVTSTGMVIGTPRYLAPEQALGHVATPATDVYSMGVVMFEMLTGRLPLETEPVEAIPGSQQSTALRLRSLAPGIPAALAAVVASALATQPSERPPTAAALLAVLDAAWSPLAASNRVAEPTLLMPAAAVTTLDGLADTDVLLSVPTNTRHSSTGSSSGRTAVLLFAGLLVVLGGVVVAATLGSGDEVDDSVVTAVSASSVPEPEPEPVPVPTEPPPTEPPTTPPSVPEPTIVEPTSVTVLPGFPATDDLEVFLLQTERDPDLLGESGAELADQLRDVVEQRGNKQTKAAVELREKLVEWVEDNEIQVAIAAALDELLAPLGEQG